MDEAASQGLKGRENRAESCGSPSRGDTCGWSREERPLRPCKCLSRKCIRINWVQPQLMPRNSNFSKHFAVRSCRILLCRVEGAKS